jgi:hypothetical protein
LRTRADRHAADAIGVNEGHAAKEVGSRLDVADLPRRDLGLPRLSVTLTESREIEDECGVSGFNELPAVCHGHLFLDREPRADDDDGRLTTLQGPSVSQEASRERNTVAAKDDRSLVNHVDHLTFVACRPPASRTAYRCLRVIELPLFSLASKKRRIKAAMTS